MSCDIPKETFRRKIDFSNEQGCWTWRGWGDKWGYGYISFNRRKYLAHRASYELFVGEIPEGMFILHECDNPSCVRPAHLSVGTQKDNLDGMARRGRSLSGERHNMVKLKSSDVLSIRQYHKEGLLSQQAIANLYNVNQTAVSKIIRGETWKNI